jgi:hypothetical protein
MVGFNKIGYFLILSIAFNQPYYSNSSLQSAFPSQLIAFEFEGVENGDFNHFNGIRPFILKKQTGFNLFFTNYIAFNNGHPNIDNYGEFYVLERENIFNSFKIGYNNNWLSINIEPYRLNRSNFSHTPIDLSTFQKINDQIDYGTYAHVNNQFVPSDLNYGHSEQGFRESSIIVHYNGLGLSYGNTSNWWGPGMHSSIVLSSNSPGMKTYTLGTLKDYRYNNYSFGFRTMVSPYKSNNGTSLYYSGLAANLTYYSNPTITVGIFRTYLSGDLSNLSSSTNFSEKWKIEDAFNLLFEPLFGQSKTNLNYTEPGTPGFDKWDELLSGFVNITFPELLLKVYLELASDDNRGNRTDLVAHWDHSLAYLIGFRKYYKIRKWKLLVGSEYLSNKPSNTFKALFYRGDPNTSNYYVKPRFDFFTYKGRRIGAHSGSSSDDLLFILGLSNEVSSVLTSFNKERHGIKSMTHPELKTEYVLTYHRKITQHHTAFITLEYEKINNFGFIQNNISISKLIWLGYSFSIN